MAHIYHLTKEAGLQKAPRKGQKSSLVRLLPFSQVTQFAYSYESR